MQFKHQYTIAQAREPLWDTLMDVHKVAGCLTGVEALEVLQDDLYAGILAVKMGPVNLKFSGEVSVTRRDRQHWLGILEANAKDAKAGGGFKAALTLQLVEAEPDATDLEITLDTTFLGRLGELGRPLIKKKINTMMDDFIKTLNAQYVEDQGNTET